MTNHPSFSSDMDVELIDHMGDESTIIRSAKVSTLKDQVDTANSAKFIDFLMEGRHMSPFEHNTVTFRIDAPIFVWREFMRHRTFSYNEQSGRYTEMRPKFYVPDLERPLVQVGKTGEYQFVEGTETQKLATHMQLTYIAAEAWDCYQEMLIEGIAKEVARMALPVNIYSTAYVTGNLRNWLKFLSLRTTDGLATYPSYPQREIEMVAEQLEEQLTSLYPNVMESWSTRGRVGL